MKVGNLVRFKSPAKAVGIILTNAEVPWKDGRAVEVCWNNGWIDWVYEKDIEVINESR